MDMPFIGEKIAKMVTGDPMTSTESAYEFLRLSSRFMHVVSLRHLRFYQLVEVSLKRQYMACITGMAPETQQDKDTKDTSLLDALMFFRDIDKEAEFITNAINTVWKSLELKGEFDTKRDEGITMLLEQKKEGNPVAIVAVELLRDAYDARY